MEKNIMNNFMFLIMISYIKKYAFAQWNLILGQAFSLSFLTGICDDPILLN